MRCRAAAVGLIGRSDPGPVGASFADAQTGLDLVESVACGFGVLLVIAALVVDQAPGTVFR